VDHRDFELVVRGYHRGQVQRYIEHMTHRLEAAQAGLDAAEELERRLLEAYEEIERLRAVATYLPAAEDAGEKIAEILGLAEQQAAQMRADAERDARAIRARALADATKARREFEAALRARREREQRCDEVLRAISATDQPAQTARARG
jgi:cell division septum initiation protein DivIVA